MFKLIYYGLFLLLYGFGAWMFFNGLQDLTTNASKASKPQPSASQFAQQTVSMMMVKLIVMFKVMTNQV